MPEFWSIFWTVAYSVASLALILGAAGLVVLWLLLVWQSR